jgi:chemotaxis signal transduction protein
MTSLQSAVPIGFFASQLANDIDVLLIMLGGRCFGLPLSDVSHICDIPPNFASYGSKVEDHFVYQGNPLTYVSLWNLLGLKSEYAEYEEMQAMLSQRRQDHIDWMSALEDAIRNNTTFLKARNPRECAFGKWYYSYHTKILRLKLVIRYFERPHAEIHQLADRLLGLVETGQNSDALHLLQESKNTTLAELLDLFDSTLELVAALQRRIVIIAVDGDDACALGADGVHDIVAVPVDHIKQIEEIGAQEMSSLIVLDDQTIVPLINWRTFFADRKIKHVSA